MDPPAKKQKLDGDIARVSKDILDKAKDAERWIEERRKHWPTKKRIEEKQAQAQLHPKQEVPKPAQRPAQNPRVCRFFLRGSCRQGSNCKFLHEKPPAGSRVYKRFEAPTKGSLFTKMVQRDIDIENDRLLDFICYLQDSGMLKAVKDQ